jgi:hypothetical protein
MGLGSAMIGGNPTTKRQDDDFYPSPPDVTVALLDGIKFTGVIHEPACGDGAMAKVMIDRGYEVVASDLVARGFGTQEDFLAIDKPRAPNIVTNPPFLLAEEFIRHALGDLKTERLALLLKSTYWHAAGRLPLFREFRPSFFLPLQWRPDFMGLKRPTMEVAWFVWVRQGDGYGSRTYYQPLPRPAAYVPRRGAKRLPIKAELVTRYSVSHY